MAPGFSGAIFYGFNFLLKKKARIMTMGLGHYPGFKVLYYFFFFGDLFLNSTSYVKSTGFLSFAGAAYVVII
jgi:hypothetical protein